MTIIPISAMKKKLLPVQRREGPCTTREICIDSIAVRIGTSWENPTARLAKREKRGKTPTLILFQISNW